MSDEIETVDEQGGVPDAPAAGGPASVAPAGGIPAGESPAADTPAAGPLSATDLARVEELKDSVDVTDAQGILGYGLPAQSRIANFADSLLGDVRNKDAGAGGEALSDLLKKVRELDVDSLGGGTGVARIPIIGKFANTFDRFATRYQKVATGIDRIVDSLERARMALLKDMTVLDKMFELNLDYLKQLDIYIAAGERVLEELHATRIPALEAEAAASSDVMVAQRLTDLQQAALRFERRLHDLKLTRMVAVQTAPQIRLIQSNDQNLVEKIQASVLTTIPLWKNQIVIAISLYRQQKALELQKNVSDTTNELLAKNAELLKVGSAKVGREVERGVIDVETLRKVNADLVATLEETIRIQDEGRARRTEAEGEIAQLQTDLRQKLLELRGSGSADRAAGRAGAAHELGRGAPPRSGVAAQREADRHQRPAPAAVMLAARTARDGGLSAVSMHGPVDDGEAEAAATLRRARRVHSVEAVEDVLRLSRSHAGTLVGDAHEGPPAGRGDAHGHGAAFRRDLDGVLDHVAHGALEVGGVAADGGRALGRLDRQLHVAALRQRAQRLHRRAHQ